MRDPRGADGCVLTAGGGRRARAPLADPCGSPHLNGSGPGRPWKGRTLAGRPWKRMVRKGRERGRKARFGRKGEFCVYSDSYFGSDQRAGRIIRAGRAWPGFMSTENNALGGSLRVGPGGPAVERSPRRALESVPLPVSHCELEAQSVSARPVPGAEPGVGYPG